MHSRSPLPRRGLLLVFGLSLLLSFAQAPGLIVADTKLDLAVDPQGFLGRAAHLWSSLSPFGQVQNQAYGYFFPHGAFFVVFDWLGVPAWVAQRLWWALLLTAGFWGIIRVAEALGIGSRPSRVVAAAAYALSPRVLTTIGAISSETTPMMLAPWALLPVILALSGRSQRPLWQLAAASSLAVALMGAINAVATAGGVAVAILWWLAHRPNRRWSVFTAWWALFGVMATLWWVIPLFLMGQVSPPFLDYIESAGTTTRWTSLVEVLRGTDSWTPFISPDRVAGAALVTQPVAVLATGAVAAAGLAGLCMRGMPAKGRLVFILLVGLAGIGAGYAGELGSPIAEQVRLFLDGSGAPLRNVHKIEPLIRLPIVLGIAHLLGRVPLPGATTRDEWQRAFARPERQPLVVVGTVTLVALVVATSVAWTGNLAPRGAYREVPDYWQQAADWLSENAGTAATADRALVVPASPFGSQVWGLTRDEPLQPLAETPWGVRDVIPLIPPGGIRAMDAIQRVVADGRSSTGLAPALMAQGYRYLVVRNDLDPDTARATNPLHVRQTLRHSPGFTKVAEFGEPVFDEPTGSPIRDAGMRTPMAPVEIYRVTAGDEWPAGPYLTDLSAVPVVQGGPEAIVGLNEAAEDASPMPLLVSSDAVDAGISADSLIVTDTPQARETDFGRVDHQRSAIRSADEPRRSLNRVPDYETADPTVFAESLGGSVTVSSSIADSTQLGTVHPGRGAAAAVDGNRDTAWLSSTFQAAVGQWLRIDFDEPLRNVLMRITTSRDATGPTVRVLDVTTNNGSTSAVIQTTGDPVAVALPPGPTEWVRITARTTDLGTPGDQFGIANVAVEADGTEVPLRRVPTLPELTTQAPVAAWHLTHEFPGRRECVEAPEQVLCSPGLAIVPEEAGEFHRRITVPDDIEVRPQLTLRAVPGAGLDDLLTDESAVHASGSSSITEPRGNAFAAMDGDPKTTWYAPLGSAPEEGSRPVLTVELPEERIVRAVRLVPAAGPAPARPTEVHISARPDEDGVTSRLERRGATTVDLDPHPTQEIRVSLNDWEEVRTPDLFGWSSLIPPGLAEIELIGADGEVLTAQSPDRVIEIGCEDGPEVRIGDSAVRMSLQASASDLQAGTAIHATPCSDDAVGLSPGNIDIVATAGGPFVVDGLRLVAAEPHAAPAVSPADVREWSDTQRVITVENADTDRLLAVPESYNEAWTAVTAEGQELTRIPVNGWQQGWVVPAGTSGAVTLTFAHDGMYRAALIGGLALLVPLALLAAFPARRRTLGPPAKPWMPRILAPIAALAAIFLIAGPLGVLAGTTLAGVALAVRHRWGYVLSSRLLTAVTATGMGGAAAALSTGPWRAASGYLGHSGWVQLLALLAVAAVATAALPAWRNGSAGG